MNYQIGDYISYNTFCDTVRRIKVTAKDPDIKNGRPGFDGIVADGPEKGSSVWGYDSQIVIEGPRHDIVDIANRSNGRISIIKVM